MREVKSIIVFNQRSGILHEKPNKNYSMFLHKFSFGFATLLRKQPKLFVSSQLLPLNPFRSNDTIFIRHAHSEFNKACEDYRLKYNIEYDWDALCRHPGFEDQVAFNPEYIDCGLTKQGVQQCYLTSHNLNLRKIDLILVSPHQRALETCFHILKFSSQKKKTPIIVEPLIAGSLWSSCDVSKRLSEKENEFKQFNFSKVEDKPQLWFIYNLRKEQLEKVNTKIKQRKLTSFREKQLLVLQMLKNKQIQESRQTLRRRSWQIKKKIQWWKQHHTNILTISHYYIIQYLNTKRFNNNNHTPIEDIDLKNCTPYYSNFQELMNYK